MLRLDTVTEVSDVETGHLTQRDTNHVLCRLTFDLLYDSALNMLLNES